MTVHLRLFASAREAAGTAKDTFEAGTLDDLLEQASARYGATFAAVLVRSKVWVNGDEVSPGHLLSAGDEVAVLPPVSGGCLDGAGPLPSGHPGAWMWGPLPT